MKQLPLREFQRHFNRYKQIDCQVLDGQGLVVGTYKPNNGLSNSDCLDSQQGNTKNIVQYTNNNEEVEKIEPCYYCKRPSQGIHTEQGDDGEDHDYHLCKVCAKRRGIKV